MRTGRQCLACLFSLLLVGFTVLACQATAPEPPAKPVEIGMNLHYRGDDEAGIKAQFDLMAAMNVTWVRVDVDWSVIESEQSQLDWTSADLIIDEAAAHKMNVLGVLAFTPPWARASAVDTESSSRSRPIDLASYSNFAQVAAERYASRGVHTWEIWNEPNSKKFWPPRVDAGEYGALFRVVAPAIRGADPKATLLIGGLAPKYHDQGAEIAPTDYLDELYDNGTAQLADGVAVHPYSFPALPMSRGQRSTGTFKDLPALHAVMDRHGDGAKLIWITEFGAPTGTGQNAVSEQDQKLAFMQARQRVSRWSWAGPLIYYELVDGGTDPTEIEDNFGVLRHDLAPKPAATELMESAPK